jgi:membrane protein implicated in regulation of membrane protease activity
MDQANWWIMDIIGPAILLVVLIWLVMRVRSSRESKDNNRAEEGTKDLYRDEESRRREGTDRL